MESLTAFQLQGFRIRAILAMTALQGSFQSCTVLTPTHDNFFFLFNIEILILSNHGGIFDHVHVCRMGRTVYGIAGIIVILGSRMQDFFTLASGSGENMSYLG